MEEIARLVREFRVAQPEPGSDEMITRLRAIIGQFDALDEIVLLKDEKHRSYQITMLHALNIMKRAFERNDLSAVGRMPFFYGVNGLATIGPTGT